jgi:hypothetical protein
MLLEISIESRILANGSPRLPRDIAIRPLNLELPRRLPMRRHLMLQDRLHSSFCGIPRSDLDGITRTAHVVPLEPEHIKFVLLEIASMDLAPYIAKVGFVTKLASCSAKARSRLWYLALKILKTPLKPLQCG